MFETLRFQMQCMDKSAYATINGLQKTRPENYYKPEKMWWNWMVVPKEEVKDAWLKNTHGYLEVAKLREKTNILPMLRISPFLALNLE